MALFKCRNKCHPKIFIISTKHNNGYYWCNYKRLNLGPHKLENDDFNCLDFCGSANTSEYLLWPSLTQTNKKYL